MTGPSAPKRCRTTRLVVLRIPWACARSGGTGWRSTEKPSPSSNEAACSACGVQSPGGLSEGALTSAARNSSCRARSPARKRAMAWGSVIASLARWIQSLQKADFPGMEDVALPDPAVLRTHRYGPRQGRHGEGNAETTELILQEAHPGDGKNCRNARPERKLLVFIFALAHPQSCGSVRPKSTRIGNASFLVGGAGSACGSVAGFSSRWQTGGKDPNASVAGSKVTILLRA